MCMKLERYKNIMSVIESFHGRNYECEKLLQEKFPDIMPETLRSIYETFYQTKMKRIRPRFHRSAKHLYQRYKAAVMNKEPLGILVRMSDEMELSAALLARLIVEEYYKEAEEEYITKVVDDSDNSGRRNPSFRADDSIRSDDTAFGLSDDDNTENSSASASNMGSKDSGEEVQKDSQEQQAGNFSTKSLDGKLSPVKETDEMKVVKESEEVKVLNKSVEMKVSKSACARGSKKGIKKTRGKHKIARSSTTEKSDTQTRTVVVTDPDPIVPLHPAPVLASAPDPAASAVASPDPAASAVASPDPAACAVDPGTAAAPDPAACAVDLGTAAAPDDPDSAAAPDPAAYPNSAAASAVIDPDSAADPDLAAAATTEQEEEYTRITVSDLINDTTLIKDKDLACEVFLCHVEDDQYGPIIDCYRQSLGHHYEARLLQWVKKNNFVIQDEAALRKFGFDKTPDVKLDLPIAVSGVPIMWIESKAIFGDEEVHQTYYNNQYIRYWNRFGPGLVIYWLGYLETIATTEERRIMIRHELPADITKFSPDSIRSRKFSEKPFGAS